MNAHAISADNAYDAGYTNFGNEGDVVDVVDVDRELLLASSEGTSIYASSVEMVTDPESYPIWRTKRPVIVVLNPPGQFHASGLPTSGGGGGGAAVRKQKHYYRYLVVTPGAANQGLVAGGIGGGDTNNPLLEVSTSDGAEGAIPVMAWEQPVFAELQELQQLQHHAANGGNRNGNGNPSKNGMMTANPSQASFLPNAQGGSGNPNANSNSNKDNRFLHLAQLPYRTLDIDVETAQPIHSGSSTASPTSTTPLDTFERPEDDAFQPYLIRETLILQQAQEKIRRQVQEAEDQATVQAGTGAAGTTPALVQIPVPNSNAPATLQSSTSTVSSVGSGDNLDFDLDVLNNDNNDNNDVDMTGDGGVAGQVVMETNQDLLHPPSAASLQSSKQQPQQHQHGTGKGKHHRRTISGHRINAAPKMLFICFHLPVVVVKGTDGKWKATWSESLLASKDGRYAAGTCVACM